MDVRFTDMTTNPDTAEVRSSTGIDLRTGRDDGIESGFDMGWER